MRYDRSMTKHLDKLNKALTVLLDKLTQFSGHPFLFLFLIVLIIIWFLVGILFKYDDVWYSIMDVFVFLTTFLLVFIVQASQNADTKALQDKLDEIIDSLSNADNRVKGEEKEIKRGKKK